MADIVPELYRRIGTTYQSLMAKDRQIARISSRIRDGTATMRDASKYAERSGVNLSQAFQTHITADALPDGKMYFNIANRTVRPMLRENYGLINGTAAEIQQIEDAVAGIGLEPVMADFPEGRVEGLINEMVDAETTEDALRWLTEPIINTCESFMDDYVQANARARQKAGLEATITRTAEGGACAWCRALVGSWEYGEEPKDIYRRHEFCRCAVTYKSGRSSQNVWSKKKWESTPEEIERRKSAEGPPVMTKEERKQAADQVARDQELRARMLEARKKRADSVERLMRAGLYENAARVRAAPTRRQLQIRDSSKAYYWRERAKQLIGG